MLNLLDRSLEAFLRAEVPLQANDVDISFEAPDKDWGAGITKPTINLFAWDIRRNSEESESGFELVQNEHGRMERRAPLPRVDFRYLVTAWTTEIMDEHALLGAVLATLLKQDRLEEQYLQGSMAAVTPVPSLVIAAAYAKDKSEFWAALGGQLKPGLDLVVTATVDAVAPFVAGPPVERYEVVIEDTDAPARSSSSQQVAGRVDDNAEGSVVVRSRRGSTLVHDDGSFLVRAEEGDEVVVEAEPPLRGAVGRAGAVVVQTDPKKRS